MVVNTFKGEKVAIIEKNKDSSWNKIVTEDGQIGWVSQYLVDDFSYIASSLKIHLNKQFK